ncbi:MAG: hypothetical protein COC19_02320 [SAR86 cluster bacterium]|uniref:ER-bound oxygenase mpaB/mpaB'/Rubber oxygenase catalytic domain-containing protein n=1 Tax=SAR86 cluster bacterium TaxID=2030880 RepID=A0A2A4MSP3_9GAMM|nr:MAG: hypothetical protein COC19_02320 [SAR86 cluster bacterium]
MRNSRLNLEHITCALTGEPLRTELLDENSMLYKMLGDAGVVYAGLAVLVLGTVQVQTIKGLKDHEPIFQKQTNTSEADKKKAQAQRLQESSELLGGIIYGVSEQDKADAAFALRELHRKIRGHLADGSRYHAWEPQVWAHAWAGIFKGIIDAYAVFRGFDTPEHRDEALLGFIEFGKVFGVKGIPDNWLEFDIYWQDFISTAVIDETVCQIASVVRNGYFQENLLERLRSGEWRAALKLIASLPKLRFARVGAMATFPLQFDQQLGIKRTLFDRIEGKIHQLIWRCVPKSWSSKLGPNSFKKRAERGHIPIWRKRLSRENLQITKNQIREQREQEIATGG